MKTWRGWILFAVFLATCIVTDEILWSLSSPEETIGQVDGLSAPIDRAVDSLVRPVLTRRELEKALQESAEAEPYLETSQTLYKHYGDMGLTQEQDKLLRKVVRHYGRKRHKFVVTAHLQLADRALRRSDREAAAEHLRNLRDIALQPRADIRLLGQIIDKAQKAHLDDLRAETLEMTTRIPHLAPKVRDRFLRDLHALYVKQNRKEQAEEIESVLQENMAALKAHEIVAALTDEINRLLQNGAPADETLLRLDSARTRAPGAEALFRPFYLRLVLEAVRQEDRKTLDTLWSRFETWKEFDPAEKTNLELLDKAAFASAQIYFAQANAPETSRRFIETFLRLERTGRMRTYIVGERWARFQPETEPPKPIYTIAYRPDANIRLDGRLDEAVYETIDPIDDPYWTSSGAGGSGLVHIEELDLVTRMLYTKDTLHLAIHAPDPYPRKLRDTRDPETATDPFMDDCMEFFIDVKRNLRFYHQWITAIGGARAYLRLDESREISFGAGRRLEWPYPVERKLECAAEVGDDGYDIEIAVPLEHLRLDGSPSGMLVGGNIRRLRYGPSEGGPPLPWPPFQRSRLLTISWGPNGHGHNPHLWNFYRFE